MSEDKGAYRDESSVEVLEAKHAEALRERNAKIAELVKAVGKKSAELEEIKKQLAKAEPMSAGKKGLILLALSVLAGVFLICYADGLAMKTCLLAVAIALVAEVALGSVIFLMNYAADRNLV